MPFTGGTTSVDWDASLKSCKAEAPVMVEVLGVDMIGDLNVVECKPEGKR